MKIRLGVSQRLNIGDYESVEIHVEVEDDRPAAELSQELSALWEKEAVARLSEVQDRRNGDTPAGEIQQQLRKK